jgi:hypothetical protein
MKRSSFAPPLNIPPSSSPRDNAAVLRRLLDRIRRSLPPPKSSWQSIEQVVSPQAARDSGRVDFLSNHLGCEVERHERVPLVVSFGHASRGAMPMPRQVQSTAYEAALEFFSTHIMVV